MLQEQGFITTDKDEKGRFLSGCKPGPGRPRGTRPKYAEAFIADFYEDWVKYGSKTIAAVRAKAPSDYLRVAVAILPKDVNVNVSVVESMSDDELSVTIKRLQSDPDILSLDHKREP